MASTAAIHESIEMKINDETYELPVVVGTYEEKGIDISQLRKQTGYVTLDPGYKNTGCTTSSITFIQGEQGILQHRGYSIEELTEHSTFLEVIYLLLHGELPKKSELVTFKKEINKHTGLPDQIKAILDALPREMHPMGKLSVMLSSLTGLMPDALETWENEDNRHKAIFSLIANMPIIVAYIYRHSKGLPYIAPNTELSYTGNFLHMMFEKVNPIIETGLDKLLILHADHEQNCSAAAVRLVGSSHVNLYAAITGGNCALWGPLHGGANQAVLEMLDNIEQDGGDVDKYIEKAKDKSDNFRLMGFGHRVYKNYDPRARVIKKYCDEILTDLNIDDPILDIATRLESAALADEYFSSRKLFPNVDFYSGIIYQAINIPTEMFTVMFAFGRLPGWISQWKEMREQKEPISRPRQIYMGSEKREYVPIEER